MQKELEDIDALASDFKARAISSAINAFNEGYLLGIRAAKDLDNRKEDR